MAVLSDSFEGLVERLRPDILAYLVRILGNHYDAEDACQDTLMHAYRAYGRLKPNSNTRAWLYKIATHTAFNLLKRRNRARTRIADMNPEDLVVESDMRSDHREQLRAVGRAIRELPVKQRAALMQRRFQGLSYAEIALSMDCSVGTARANVYQAIKKLRAALAKT